MPENDGLLAIEFFFQQTELLVNFLIILLGIAFGNLRIKGVGFGSSGVLIAAMVAGYLYQFEPIIILQDLGIVLFLLCVGLEAGPSFFRAFRQHGREYIVNVLVLLAIAGVDTGGHHRPRGHPHRHRPGPVRRRLHLQPGADQRAAVQSRRGGDLRLRRGLPLRPARGNPVHHHRGEAPAGPHGGRDQRPVRAARRRLQGHQRRLQRHADPRHGRPHGKRRGGFGHPAGPVVRYRRRQHRAS
ncbi:MAG: hypothetical protein U5L11_17360 [Arhodomonas sp.]|nr:hypothetical protein [Arhodomonas sp.]